MLLSRKALCFQREFGQEKKITFSLSVLRHKHTFSLTLALVYSLDKLHDIAVQLFDCSQILTVLGELRGQ